MIIFYISGFIYDLRQKGVAPAPGFEPGIPRGTGFQDQRNIPQSYKL